MTLSAFTISEMAANWHKLLPVRLFAIIVLYIYISQGSVTTQLKCKKHLMILLFHILHKT